MRYIWSLLVVLVISSGLTYSAGIDKIFIHKGFGEESLFFIFNQSLPACRDTKSITKSIDFDYTYLQKTDSVSMLITLQLKNTVKDISADIKTDKSTYSFEPELIYADAKRGKIAYRLRLTMPFKWFVNMYESQLPFIVSFHYVCLDKQESIRFRYNDKKWVENREKLLSIIELININTEKR